MVEKAHAPVTRLLSAMLLVAGTCIGGGMLALPVASGGSGFVPSVAAMVLCWALMTATALLILEVTLSMEPDIHVMTMATRLLGPIGKWVTWFLFLYATYASIVAYTAGGGVTTATALEQLLGMDVSKAVGCIVFVAVFGTVICLGTHIVGEVNSILFMALIGAYVMLLVLGGDEVQMSYLRRVSWSGWWTAIPIILTGFSHQVFIIPSLTRYLDRNVQSLRWALVGGTTITLLVYVLWQWLILGTVPLEGPHGLETAFIKGDPATEYMRRAVESPFVSFIAEFFGYFALVTSFLGMSLGLFDFLRDGFHVHRTKQGRLLLGLAVAVPTVIIAIYFERVFLLAMDTSGGIGDAILNGMMPVLMVWVLRYRMKEKADYRLRGGKLLLIGIFLFYLLAFCQEIQTLASSAGLLSISP